LYQLPESVKKFMRGILGAGMSCAVPRLAIFPRPFGTAAQKAKNTQLQKYGSAGFAEFAQSGYGNPVSPFQAQYLQWTSMRQRQAADEG
jgi:hypothetical protein